MALPGRICAYIALGVALLVAFDPRTWGEDLDTGSGDEIGIVLAGQFVVSAAAALCVLAVVVVAIESVVRSRKQRRHARGKTPEPEASRSWYE